MVSLNEKRIIEKSLIEIKQSSSGEEFRYNKETEAAIAEARKIISGKQNTRAYRSAEELFADLDKE